MKFIPDSTPRLALGEAERLLKKHGLDPSKQLCLLGVRGYYLDTMGKPGENDRAIYDDAIFIVGPQCFQAFNANCDPGAFRKRIANLKAGVWLYKIGIHGLSKPKHLRYKALVQAGDVTVVRDQVGEDTGRFAINIHRGGNTKVSSLGCQTIVPSQWTSFIATVESQMKQHDQKTISYCLTEVGL